MNQNNLNFNLNLNTYQQQNKDWNQAQQNNNQNHVNTSLTYQFQKQYDNNTIPAYPWKPNAEISISADSNRIFAKQNEDIDYLMLSII